eukprot:gene4231-7568_t
MNRLRAEQVSELKEAFSLFDGDGDGFVTIDEISTALQAMGLDTDKEIQANIKSLNLTRKNKDKGVDYEEFENLMTPILADVSSESELNEAFRVFDTKNNGHVSVSDIEKILIEYGDKLTKQDVRIFFF